MRNLLHKNKLEAFKQWLEAKEIPFRVPEGAAWQVLQVRVDGNWLSVYERVQMKEHYSTDRRMDHLVREFCEDRKVTQWPTLTAPAMVGSVTFREGVSTRLVVETAMRHYEEAQNPPAALNERFTLDGIIDVDPPTPNIREMLTVGKSCNLNTVAEAFTNYMNHADCFFLLDNFHAQHEKFLKDISDAGFIVGGAVVNMSIEDALAKLGAYENDN